MDKAEIDRIIREGTVKEKIVLYFTSIAYNNTQPDFLLTEEEEQILWSYVQEPKDLKYYNQLREYNKAFVLFKERYTASKNQFLRVQETVRRLLTIKRIRGFFLDTINNMLKANKSPEDSKILSDVAVKNLRDYGLFVRAFSEEGENNNFRIIAPDLEDNIALEEAINLFNATAMEGKQYISALKVIKRHLPLPPYEKYIKLEEKLLSQMIKDYIFIKGVIPYSLIEVDITEEDRLTILNQRHL